ncbi:MAG: sterol desaturase family protein, partial [bacterium]|nr:sterol desaturase family protein [bacterium]
MTDVKTPASGHRRDWIPEEPIEFAPFFVWPPQPRKLATYLFGWGGFLWPWRAIWLGLAIGSWYWLSPSLAEARNLEFGWIATIFIRNLVFIWVIAGGIHLVLYTLKLQGTDLKHDPRWLAVRRRRFLFKSQVRDNVFWSCVSGVTIWTAWEVLFLYGYAHGWVPYLGWSDNPVLFLLMFPVVVIFRKIHFYFTH